MSYKNKENKKLKRKRGRNKGLSERGLLKINLLLRRADIFNVRPMYSEAHYRRRFGMKKLVSAVKKAIYK